MMRFTFTPTRQASTQVSDFRVNQDLPLWPGS